MRNVVGNQDTIVILRDLASKAAREIADRLYAFANLGGRRIGREPTVREPADAPKRSPAPPANPQRDSWFLIRPRQQRQITHAVKLALEVNFFLAPQLFHQN